MKTSLDFCDEMLKQVHVAVVPGSAFGDDTCIRLSFATSMKQIEDGLDRIEKFINNL